MIKEVIVVEGRRDAEAVKRAVEADTLETGGSAIGAEILEQIRIAHSRRGVIVLTDPDYAGERIRKIISRAVPGVKHAFIGQEEGRKKGDIGVENASPEAIRRALELVRTEMPCEKPQIEWEDLIDLGLVGGADAAKLREMVGKILGIGHCNGKQFYRRLALFRISREEFIQAYEEAERRCGDGRGDCKPGPDRGNRAETSVDV